MSEERKPRLRFGGFEGEWEEKRLGDICETCGGGTPSKDTLEYWTGDIPWISSSDIYEDNIHAVNITRHITKEAIASSATKLCPKGTILVVSRVGVGKVAIANSDLCTSQDFTNLLNVACDNQFLAYQLSKIMKIKSRQTQGTSIKGVTTNEIKSLVVSISDIQEQRKIAEFISAVDEKTSFQSQKIDGLENLKRVVMQKIFSRELRFKDENGEEFWEWDVKELRESCNGFDSMRIPVSADKREAGNIPYYGANGIQDYVKDYIFDGEYVLLAEDGGNFDDFMTRPIAQFICGKSWVNNHAHIIQAKEGYLTKYIYYSLVHKDIRTFINGTSRSKLNQADMWKIKIPVPCFKEQKKITDFLSTFDEKIAIEKQSLEKWQAVKKGLLQQMFV